MKQIQSTRRKQARRSKPEPMVREYGRGFAPEPGESGHTFKIARIPDALWDRVIAKAKHEGVSLRHLVLRHLDQWAAQ